MTSVYIPVKEWGQYQAEGVPHQHKPAIPDGICSVGKARLHFHPVSCCLVDLGRKLYSWQSLSGDSVSPQSASVCSYASSFNHNINFFLESFKSKIKWAYCQTLHSPGELHGTISPVQFLETPEVVTSELSSFLTLVALIETKLKALTPLRIQWFHTVWPTLIYTFANAINIFPVVWLFWLDFHLPLSCPKVTINEKMLWKLAPNSPLPLACRADLFYLVKGERHNIQLDLYHFLV